MDEYTTVEMQVEYGLAGIASERTVEVSLRDLLYVHQVIGELVRFFHQPMHYNSLESVQQFLGDRDQGAFHLLAQCYYHKLREVWPPDVVEMFNNSELEHPSKPYYYGLKDEGDNLPPK